MRAMGTMRGKKMMTRSNRLRYFEQAECDIIIDSNVKQGRVDRHNQQCNIISNKINVTYMHAVPV